MKKIFKILMITLLFTGNVIVKENVSAQQIGVSLSVFQNSLSSYGRWMNHGTYGQVWIANTPGFVPYQTGGHWAYTDYGWTWVSDYDWGWAPFHYGRWAYENGFGWYWVPGYEWAPAWVAWRDGGDYYGWAPLSPGLNISVGVSYGNQIPYDRWVFAPHRYITSPYINRYYMPRTRNVTIIKNTTVINNVNVRNNVNYVSGPRREDVERVNHTKIQAYTVSNSSKPGRTVVNNNTVNVYRPVINNNTVVNKNNTTVNKNNTNKNSNNKITDNKQVITKNNGNTVIDKNNNNTKVSNTDKSVQRIQPNNPAINRNDAGNKPQPVIKNNNAKRNVTSNNLSVPVNSNTKFNNNRSLKRAEINNNQLQRKSVQQRQLNNHPVQVKPMNNNRPPQMQKQMQRPNVSGGNGNRKKPGR